MLPTLKNSVLEKHSLVHKKVLDNWSERERRKKCESADNDDGSNQQPDPKRAVCRQRAGGFRDALLARQAPGDSEHRDNDGKAPYEHCQPNRQVVPGRVDVNSREGAAVVSSS